MWCCWIYTDHNPVQPGGPVLRISGCPSLLIRVALTILGSFRESLTWTPTRDSARPGKFPF